VDVAALQVRDRQTSLITFRVSDALSYGWKAYLRNIGPMLLLALIIVAVNLLLSYVGTALDNGASQIALNLLSLIIGIMLAMGLIRAGLAVVQGDRPDAGMLVRTDGFGSYLVASILFLVGAFVGLIALIIPGIAVLVMWQFFGYVIVEAPTTRATDALRRSAAITKGYRWKLFGLGLSLLALNFLGVLACGVGVIFTYGISAITLAYAYRTLSSQWVAPL
jgi:hypothetical protein